MILDWLLPVLLSVALLLAVAGMLKRISLWRAGQPEKVSLIAGLLAMPRAVTWSTCTMWSSGTSTCPRPTWPLPAASCCRCC